MSDPPASASLTDCHQLSYCNGTVPHRDKYDWLLDFLEELRERANPPIPLKFARTVAVNEWGRSADRNPVQVAREWLNARPKPTM